MERSGGEVVLIIWRVDACGQGGGGMEVGRIWGDSDDGDGNESIEMRYHISPILHTTSPALPHL